MVEMVPGNGGACLQAPSRHGLRAFGGAFSPGSAPGQDRGLSDWSLSVVSGHSARVRPLGMALVMCVLVNSAKALFLPEACEHQECRPVRGHVTARATLFVPIC